MTTDNNGVYWVESRETLIVNIIFMENYYKYHCGDCGTEWTKDDEQFVKGLLALAHENQKSQIEQILENLELDAKAPELEIEEKEKLRKKIAEGKTVLKNLVKNGPEDHKEYMNGVNCPKCGSNSISGQEKEK